MDVSELRLKFADNANDSVIERRGVSFQLAKPIRKLEAYATGFFHKLCYFGFATRGPTGGSFHRRIAKSTPGSIPPVAV